jgi:LacI family transcriptional regulator
MARPNSPTGSGRPSVKDVAARAGVSLGTVSNVLNRPETVRPATRSRVEDAMAELSFVRNDSARQLRAGQSNMLAYLTLDYANPFFTDVARGMEDVAAEAGVGLFLCSSGQDPARESEYLERLLEQRVRGVCVTAVDYANPLLRRLPQSGIPVVLVDRAPEAASREWCSVGVNDVDGGELAVAHLLEQGHDRIVFVGGSTVPQVVDRLAGARSALAAAGHDPDALLVLDTKALSVEEGRLAGQRLLGVPERRRPTAAFCVNDLLALGLLQQLSQRGARVPDDMAIVGYDNIDFAAAAAVPLTSVNQPRLDMGRAAAEMVLAEGGLGDHQHDHLRLDTELVVRESSAGA